MAAENYVPDHREIRIADDLTALQHEAAAEIYRCATGAIQAHGRFSIALSGGNTPRDVYKLLAVEHKDDLPWNKVSVFFGDERHVPLDHSESNYRMANEALLSKVNLPAENIFRVPAELAPDVAAQDYEEQIRNFFHLSPGSVPEFDLVLLGLGDDGHTASLFPGSAALQEDTRLFVANWVEKMQTWRLTLTFPVLNNAREVLFLVAGASKAGVIKTILGESSTTEFPAQRVQPRGKLIWLLDRDAASLVPAEKQ